MAAQLFTNREGVRGGMLISGLTYADVYAIIRKRLEYVPGNFDPDAVCQAICCELEKAMGIYPNVPGLRTDDL